jgi:glutamate racemase
MSHSPSPSSPLGVFDSGVGGLTVLAALRARLPHEDLIYLGDTARVPYGSKPLEMVRGFALEISLNLVARGVKGIVIACNTASAASLPALAAELPVPVWGVIEPGVRAALRAAPGGHVGVLGTVGTILTGAYQQGLEAGGCRVWAKPCPLFVPIVEEGVSDTAIAKLVAQHYLADAPPLDAVILGCTHYPALKPILSEVLGGAPLVDSAEATAAQVATDLATLGLRATRRGAGTVQHLVTGDLASYRHTAGLLGGPAGPMIRTELGAPLATTPNGSSGDGSNRDGSNGATDPTAAPLLLGHAGER